MVEVSDSFCLSECGAQISEYHLSAQRSCEEVLMRSFKLIDEGRASAVVDLFVDDGEHVLEGERCTGQKLSEFFKSREAMKERKTRHSVTNMLFNLVSSEEAEIRYTSVLYQLPNAQPTTVADIRDTFVKLNDPARWFLCSRNVVIVAGSR